MPTVVPTLAMQVELSGSGGGWTDVSADVNLGASPVAIEYGIRGGGPLDRIATVGTMSWAMKNSVRSSGGVNGYYTPGHANCRSGWELGIAVRIGLTDPTTGFTHYKFRGTLVSVVPDAGLYRRRAVICMAYDWIDDALNSLVKDTAVQTNQRSDQLITTIITNCVARQPAAQSLATGQSTFAYAMDNLRDERTSALRALADATYAEVGYFYVKGDTTQGGTVTFESRHTRPLASSSGTFDETMFEMVATRSRDDILNHIIAMVHPRKIDAAATTVLYELTPTETVPAILPGETIALTALYRESSGRYVRVGGSDIVTPVASTDYVANSQADGGGSDLTASLSLVFASTSNTASMAFTNNHGSLTAYLTTLQVRGKAVQDRYEIAVESTNTTSQTAYGERDLVYDMIFEDDVSIAKGVADWFANLYASPRMVVSEIGIKGNDSTALLTHALAREPGDKIVITESMTGVDGAAYFINGVRLSIGRGKIVDANWVLAPGDQQQAWILEDAVAGLLGLTTVLGYA